LLKEKGWNLVNPLAITRTPEKFRQNLEQSKGEFSVAKQGYVISHSGWFSERSAGYLATGRPVITQDTGFSELIETGRGLFSFSTVEEVLASIRTVNSNYPMHCRYAKELAGDYFNSDIVLNSMLKQLT